MQQGRGEFVDSATPEGLLADLRQIVLRKPGQFHDLRQVKTISQHGTGYFYPLSGSAVLPACNMSLSINLLKGQSLGEERNAPNASFAPSFSTFQKITAFAAPRTPYNSNQG